MRGKWIVGGGSLIVNGGSLVVAIAQRHHATAAQVALVWLLRRSPIVVPIPGTASIAHFEENLGALDVELDAAEIDALTRR